METIFKITSYIKPNKKKERFETILEPLQAIIQLALLSFCPIGTKLSISKNILEIHSFNWNQSLIRTYNCDTRDDIFFLFSVIKRYNSFYSYMNKLGSYHNELYNKLIKLSILGIDNLLLTYANTTQQQLLHTLRIYKMLLLKPDAFNDDSNNENTSMFKISDANQPKENIDEIFVKIIKLYSDTHFKLLNNIFNLLDDDKNNYEIYIKAVNTIFIPINENIKKWINENIIF